MTRKQKKMLRRILAAATILIVLQVMGAGSFDALFGGAGRWVRLGCYLANYLLIGGDILRKALRNIRNGQVFDENFLMAIATVGAMALAIYENGDYLEAIAVMLFYQIGEWFQSYAVGKSRRSITELMDIRPDYANIEHDGVLEQVDPDDVEVGTVITVQRGEKVPIDGIVVEGVSSLNTAALTGESAPREVALGDEVLSGCIAMTGRLKIQTTHPFGESTVSKILDLVENASSRKSQSEDFIAKFARIYTPAVCYAALALFLVPPVVSLLLGNAAGWGMWLHRALTFLVISCPCALVISIPLSFFAGLGGASREGVLIKGSNYLEALSKVRWVAFDKTGTLTEGTVAESGAVSHDTVKPTAREAVALLKKCGVTRTVILSGDKKEAVAAVAAEVGITHIHSQLLPDGKVAMVEQLLQEAPTGVKVAFVGDGINDAPVLARADIGIAMGAMGSDAAIEAADVVLMDDDPRKLSKAIAISRKCMGIVYQNIVFALAVKFICLALGARGTGGMYLAIFADVGVMVLAVLNAMRCLWAPKQ